MALLEEVSRLTGQGKATLASELVEMALPAIQATIEALRVVKDAPREAQRILSKHSHGAMMELSQQMLEFDDILSNAPTPKRQKRKRGTDGPP
jgi:hypothetical protein